MYRSAGEAMFVELQAAEIVAAVLGRLGCADIRQLPPIAQTPAEQLPVTPIRDPAALTRAERAALATAYRSRHGVAAFAVDPGAARGSVHPLLAIAEQLREELPVRHPVEHPAERAPFVREVFGGFDGTTKIFDVGGAEHDALTCAALPPHFDGTGNGGAVVAFGLYLDSPPGGVPVNYFQNLLVLSLALLRSDEAAFLSLFLPDAIRMDWQGLQLARPILSVGPDGAPQAFFRADDSDAVVALRPGCAPLERARKFLDEHTGPFAAGSGYLRLDRAGMGCFVDNTATIHGRTAYTNTTGTRVLSRKWWVRHPDDQQYRIVAEAPVHERFADLLPEHFEPRAQPVAARARRRRRRATG